MIHRLLLLLVAIVGAQGMARAAESYDNCTGYIDTLPASIAKSGTWCLRKDLSTAMDSGAAINILANNATIDCNDFKIGNLAAGGSTLATGIAGDVVHNATIRNCRIRGFRYGVRMQWHGSGHLVEDNLVELSVGTALWVDGDHAVVRRNRVYDTGPTVAGNLHGILAQGEGIVIADNIVVGVSGSPDFEGEVSGIHFHSTASLLRGNFVSTILKGAGSAAGISGSTFRGTVLEQNTIVNAGATNAIGIDVNSDALCLNNRVRNFTLSALGTCTDGGGNYSN